MKFRKVFDALLYYILLPLVSLSYILVPLTNDARIYIGVEYIADTFYQLPQGWDIAWEIKPIGNRIFNWMLYKVAAAIVPFDNAVTFGIAVKAVSLVIIIAISYYFASKVKMPYGFALTFLSFTAIANFVILQSEYWAVAFSLVAIGLILTEKAHNQFIAGALFVIIGLFKGITCMMFIPILCAVYLLNPNIEFRSGRFCGGLFSGWAFAVGAFFLLNDTIFPHMLSDMLMSAQIARVGMYGIQTYLMSMLVVTYGAVLFMPLLIIACFIALIYFVRCVATDKTQAAVFLTMWAVPFGVVFVQGEFFIYQFFVLTVPALVTVVLWERLK